MLVNSAGIGIGGTVEKLQTKHLDLQLGVNLRGLLLVTREAIPLLRESKGWIVNLASIAGTLPTPGLTVYGATKAAVIALTRSQNLELDDDGVRAVAICPGFVDTPMAEWSGLASRRDDHAGRLRRGRADVPAPLAERAHPAGRDRARRLARPGRMKPVTVAERPDLAEPAWELTRDTFPEYNNHGDVLNAYWGGLTEKYPEFQFHLVDDGEQILARARCVPVRWDGTLEDLPAGIDGAIARAFDEGGANVLCAMVIQVPPGLQGRGVSAAALGAMSDIARVHGLHVADRAGAAELEGPLPADADRALRRLAPRRRPPVRPVAARPRARRRDDPATRAGVASHHRLARRVGGVGRHAVP